MAIPQDVVKEAARGGYQAWVNVLYLPMAEAIRCRLNSENPKHDASIGLMPDDSYVVWYKPGQHK